MKLETTDTELHKLATIEDSTREGTEMVRVPRVALRNLLRDHHTLYSKATGSPARGGKGHKVELGADQESMKGEAA